MKFKSKEEEHLVITMFHILSELQNPTLICNSQGDILYANKTYHALSKIDGTDKVFWSVFPISRKTPEYFQKSVDRHIETRTEVKVGDNTYITRVIPTDKLLSDQVVYFVYFEDISETVHLTNQLKQEKNILQKSYLEAILAFSEAVELTDLFTAGHQKRVAQLSLNIAYKAGITDKHTLSAVYYGALLHDIGKLTIPMEYLVLPRRLTLHEYEIIKTHVISGSKIIEHLDFPWDIKSVVLQHHERLDGSGYPNGLKAKSITIPARIVAVADVVEAMSTDKPYRKSVGIHEIVEYLQQNKDVLFDGRFVDSLLLCIEELDDLFDAHPDFTPFDLLDFLGSTLPRK